jgi:hypothetical protein
MEAVIATLTDLGKHKTFVSAEESLMKACHSLDPFLTANLPDSDAMRIFPALLDLFLCNKGEYSLQCAIYIASTLVKLFEVSSVPKLWDVINIGEVHSTPALLIATGHICKHVGGSFKSQLPHFIELAMKHESPMEFAALHAMRSAFKSGGKYVSHLALPAYEYTKRVIDGSATPTSLWIALRFLRTLIKVSISPTQILEAALLAMKHREQPYLLNEIASVVARAIFAPYSKLNLAKIIQSAEWSIGSMKNQRKTLNFTPAFQAIRVFTPIFAGVWTNFLSLLGPELIAMHHSDLFEFVRENSPECVKLLIPMLPADLRFSYFQEVAREPPSAEQLETLMILCPDDGCIEEAAAVALLLAASDDRGARRAAVSFFAQLTQTHSHLVLPHLRACLAYLLQPPEHRPRVLIELRGNAAVLCAVLDHLPDVQTAVVPNYEAFVQLVAEVCRKPRPTSCLFICTFAVLAALPEAFSRLPGVDGAVDSALQCLASKSPDRPPKTEKRLLKSVARFRARYPHPAQNQRLIALAMAAKAMLPCGVVRHLSRIIPRTVSGDAQALPGAILALSAVLQLRPSKSFIKSRLKRPLPIIHDVLAFRKTISAEQLKQDEFLGHFIANFPGLLDSCQPAGQDQLLHLLLSTFSVTSLLILASICHAPEKLPDNFCEYCLSHLGRDASLVQVISECVAIYARHRAVAPHIFQYTRQHRDVASCILLSAVFTHVEVQSEYLPDSIVLLNSLMKNPSSAAIATYALTSLILTQPMQLPALDICATQFRMLFELLHSPASLQPLTLFVIGECFGALIEAFPAELNDDFAVLLELILTTIHATPISYGKEIYFESSRAIFLFAHQLSRIAPISYPKSVCGSASLQLRACAAFSDFLKFEKMDFDVTKLMRTLLTLLQRTSDPRASQFIASLASFMRPENVSFWIATIKRILISDSLLEGSWTIEPTPEVKLTCLQVANFIVPTIAGAPQLITEHLDDVISSVCRATETDRLSLQEAAFPPLQKVIELFSARLTDEGQRLLDLYDSQFSMAVRVGFRGLFV